MYHLKLYLVTVWYCNIWHKIQTAIANKLWWSQREFMAKFQLHQDLALILWMQPRSGEQVRTSSPSGSTLAAGSYGLIHTQSPIFVCSCSKTFWAWCLMDNLFVSTSGFLSLYPFFSYSLTLMALSSCPSHAHSIKYVHGLIPVAYFVNLSHVSLWSSWMWLSTWQIWSQVNISRLTAGGCSVIWCKYYL